MLIFHFVILPGSPYRTFTNSTRNNQTSQKLKNTNTFSGRIIIYFSKTVTGYMVWEQLPGFRSDERAVAGPAHHTATWSLKEKEMRVFPE